MSSAVVALAGAAVLAGATVLHAQPSPPNRAVAIAKKLELLQRYLQSSRSERIDAGDDAIARELLARARERETDAMRAFEQGALERSERLLGEAFRAYRAALDAGRPPRDTAGEVRRRNAELRAEVATYRQVFEAALQEKGPAAAALLDREHLARLIADADRLESDGDHAAARVRLEEAVAVAVAAVTRIRQNDTVVYSLDFRTPADEFRYERNRHDSYRLLVRQMERSGESGERARALAQRYAAEGEALRERAEHEAAAGRYAAAIRTMEEANRRLVRALRMMGLSIPG